MRSLVRPILLLTAYAVFPSLYLRPIWASLLMLVLLAYRFYLDYRSLQIPPKWLMWIIQISSGVAVYIHYSELVGGEAGGTLLCILTVLKTFELRIKRDFFVMTLLCSLSIMCHALLEQGLMMTAFLVAGVLFNVVAMHAIEDERWEWKTWRSVGRSSLLLTLQTVPLIVVTFLLFPRFSTGFGTGDALKGQTGVTDSLQPGSVAKLIPSDELIFRATFLDGLPPMTNQLYWRGAVLDISDGINWTRSPETDSFDKPQTFVGAEDVEIYLEPGSNRLLFTLEGTLGVSFNGDLEGRRVRLREGGTFELRQSLQVRERYSMILPNPDSLQSLERLQKNRKLRSRLQTPEQTLLPEASRWLQVSPASPKLQTWLRSWEQKSTGAIVRGILTHFRRGGYQYSLEPPPSESIDEFLFNTKVGFCEHFAGSLATLLRHLKVPARVIVGFQGGTPSVLGDYVTVRGHDAHAWVEYFDTEKSRWRRADPTAELAPARLAQGSDTYLNSNHAFLPPWLPPNWVQGYFRARAVVDQVDATWTSFLLGFDLTWQRSILERMGMDAVLFKALPVFLLLALILTLAILYFLQAQRREPLSIEDRLYKRLLAILRLHGIDKSANEGPQTLKQKVANLRPDLVLITANALDPLNDVRYGKEPMAPATKAEVRLALRQLARQPRAKSHKPSDAASISYHRR